MQPTLTMQPTLLRAACASLVLSALAHADFQNPFVPSFRGQPNTEYGGWESFTNPSLLPNSPDLPGATTVDATIVQFLTSAFLVGGNIYSFADAVEFELADTVPGYLREVAFQTSTKGAELDYANVVLNYVDGSGVPQQVAPTSQTELFFQVAQGVDVETLFEWDLTTLGDDVTSYTITFEAFEPSLSLDAVTLDTRFDEGPRVYCSAKVNSAGCTPQIAFGSGTASTTNPQPFTIEASMVLENKNGLLFYGLSGPAVLPFLGGTLCVQPPLRRTTIQNAGTDGSACGGLFSTDFNAWIQGGNDPNLTVGTRVNAQYWSRDPQSSSGTGLTDAVEFTILD